MNNLDIPKGVIFALNAAIYIFYLWIIYLISSGIVGFVEGFLDMSFDTDLADSIIMLVVFVVVTIVAIVFGKTFFIRKK